MGVILVISKLKPFGKSLFGTSLKTPEVGEWREISGRLKAVRWVSDGCTVYELSDDAAQPRIMVDPVLSVPICWPLTEPVKPPRPLCSQ